MAERSQLGRKIANGEFVVMVEVVPPHHDLPIAHLELQEPLDHRHGSGAPIRSVYPRSRDLA